MKTGIAEKTTLRFYQEVTPGRSAPHIGLRGEGELSRGIEGQRKVDNLSCKPPAKVRFYQEVTPGRSAPHLGLRGDRNLSGGIEGQHKVGVLTFTWCRIARSVRLPRIFSIATRWAWLPYGEQYLPRISR